MKRAVILPVIDGAAIQRSLAEILSGPVAFPVSRLVKFFKTSDSVSSEKQKVTGEEARLTEWFG